MTPVSKNNVAARRVLKRILLTLVAIALAIPLLLFLSIQVEQRIVRHRAERLLADFHSIRLRQSTWQDAQALMQKWHAYGGADGECNESQCAYGIEVKDSALGLSEVHNEKWADRLYLFHVVRMLERLGAHPSELDVYFIVQDGKIVRSSTSFAVQDPPYTAGPNDYYGLLLVVEAKTRSVLRAYRPSKLRDDWALGDDEQLADHPDYKAARPLGCVSRENCDGAEITYTPFLDPSEIERLTSFNLACMTRFRSCTTVGDLLPVAQPWHLYEEGSIAPRPNTPQPSSHACTTAPRALGRDTLIALEVEALTTDTRLHPARPPYFPAASYETSTVRILSVLAGSPARHAGEDVTIRPFAATSSDDRPHLSEHLLPHHRYIILFNDDDFDKEEDTIETSWCGVLEDTPPVLAAINEGLSQVDTLRRHEYVLTQR
jgi:hypothetical protein